MTLLSPWMLLGLGALAVPIWVHLVHRHNEQRKRFPSLMFLEQLTEAERSRRTLRDRALLALRLLALAIAVLAFAAPFIERDAITAKSASSTVILIDESFSMGGGGRFEEGIAAAEDAIASATLRQNESIAIVAFSDEARVISELSTDTASLEAALAALKPRDRPTRYARAFDEATRLLNAAPPGPQRVLLISDLQSSAVGVTPALRLPENAGLDIVNPGGAIARNVAIVGVEVNAANAAEHRIEATVRNTGTDAITDHGVRIVADRRQLVEENVSLAPGEETRVSATLVLAADQASRISVTADDDELSADNSHVVLGVRGRRLHVVIAEPERARRNQSVYLREALAVETSPGVTTKTIKETSLENPEAYSDADVLVLNDVSTSVKAEGEIIRFVERGGGLLTVAGQNTRFLNNIDVPLMFPTTSTNELGAVIVSATRDHASQLTRLFEGPLSNVRIRSWRSLPRDSRVQELARLDTGSTLIAELAHTGGRHLVITTTLDPAWSNLALEPGFVALTRSLIDYLAGRHPPVPAYALGLPVDLQSHVNAMPRGAAGPSWPALFQGGRVVVEAPDGQSTRPKAGSTVFRPQAAGMHEIHGAGAKIPLPVNIDPAESLFEPTTPAARTEPVTRVPAPGASVTTGTRDAARGRGIAWYLLLLAATLLAIETGYAAWLAARNQGTAPKRGQEVHG